MSPEVDPADDTREPSDVSAALLLFGGRYDGMPAGEGITNAARFVRTAEKHGWREAWAAEHHFNPNLDSSSAITLAGFLLGNTERMRSGTAASVLSVWHPVALAEQANIFAHASGGRFALKVARGMPTIDGNILGDDEGRAHPSVFGEALDLLLPGLRGEAIEATRGSFRFSAVNAAPRPGEANVPVYVAANNEPTVRVAAARRLPLLLPLFLPTPAKQVILDHYRDEAERRGFDSSGTPHYNAAIAHVSDDRGHARRDLESAWVPWFTAVARDTPAITPIPAFSSEQRAGMLAYQALGVPEQVAAHLRAELALLGFTRTLLIVDGTGRVDDAERTVTTLAEVFAAPGGMS